jgi:ATP-dependent RNA helicase DDX23/PRP28
MREQRKASRSYGEAAEALRQRSTATATATATAPSSAAEDGARRRRAGGGDAAMEVEDEGGGGARDMGIPGSHWSEKSLEAMTDRDWRIMREDYDIHVRGGRALNPLRRWDECDMAPELRQAIDAMGYKEPSPIQRQAIPMGLAGRDLIGIAETGSGKTAAFLIPLLTYILQQPAAVRDRVADSGPLALVMAPTRELAQQIEEECTKLARFSGIRSASVVGGVAIAEQGVRLRQGVDVVIGTPGRLIDTLESR